MKQGSCRGVFLFTFLALMGLSGCATRMEIGSPPRVERLSQLIPHVSTTNDVLLTLGEPRAYGAARLDPNLKQQSVWGYEYMVSEGRNVQLTMLLIFFTGDEYDGYMWFADKGNLKEYPRSKGR
jgi:hypothetical protein